MAHKVKKQDLDDYVKCLAVKSPVGSVNRTKAHWDLIMNRKACLEAIQSYKGEKVCSFSLCGKWFKDRCNRNSYSSLVSSTYFLTGDNTAQRYQLGVIGSFPGKLLSDSAQPVYLVFV